MINPKIWAIITMSKFSEVIGMINKTVKLFKKILGRISLSGALAFSAFVVLSLTVAIATTPIDGEKELYAGIIRFHVLANSDLEEDQSLKLKVRDSVTQYTGALLSECTSVESAKKIIEENSGNIVSIASECVKAEGYNYDVSISLGNENYPRRTYGDYTFPAGEYYSVRLKIGKAEGKNWWCVLFPPMCQSGAIVQKYENSDELLNIGFTESEVKLISETDSSKTKIRFFFLDLFNKLK